jgi:hypothetical protein
VFPEPIFIMIASPSLNDTSTVAADCAPMDQPSRRRSTYISEMVRSWACADGPVAATCHTSPLSPADRPESSRRPSQTTEPSRRS